VVELLQVDSKTMLRLIRLNSARGNKSAVEHEGICYCQAGARGGYFGRHFLNKGDINYNCFCFPVLTWGNAHEASHRSKEGEWKYSFVLKKGRKNSGELS
jgi:hypothetical protein